MMPSMQFMGDSVVSKSEVPNMEEEEVEQKMLSVRIPVDRHKALKSSCVGNGVSIRSVILAAISEIESGSAAGRALLISAASDD